MDDDEARTAPADTFREVAAAFTQRVRGVPPGRWDEALRCSGHYGPRQPVAAGADVQTRLLAFIGRRV